MLFNEKDATIKSEMTLPLWGIELSTSGTPADAAAHSVTTCRGLLCLVQMPRPSTKFQNNLASTTYIFH
ncbi:hypothetical protein OUZ56_032985 [Daphnia magna]|uniref:Uncharacterized protein n=1 Tax=Daphnia magna TaxID=35525 RepID=A0ABR0B9X2_9CRUS|nr:hypothetical protein OUZ56_032985 [Daphnia magna]